MHFLWGWPICLLLDLTIRWQTSFEADIKLQGCTLRELFKYIKPIKDGWWRWERVAQKPSRSYYIGVQGHFYWAPPEAVSWWGFSWIKGSQIVCRGHLSHPKTVFWYTKCGIVFNHLYDIDPSISGIDILYRFCWSLYFFYWQGYLLRSAELSD